MTGYRTASKPVPTVTHLEVAGRQTRTFYAVAAASLLLPALSLAHMEIGAVVAATFAAAALMLAGRYGRTRARLELEPGSGAITLVTHGFLAPATRRTFQVEDIVRITATPIVPGAVGSSPTLVMPMIELASGERVDVFGRPLGLGEDEARWILTLIERQLANARPKSALPRTRVAPAPFVDGPEAEAGDAEDASSGSSASRD